MRMSATAQRLERFLEEAHASRAAEEDPALERLRQVQREIEEAYDAIDRLLSADPPATVEEKQAAFAVLEDALAREAAALKPILEARMPSLARADEALRRADELIARYEKKDDS